MVRTTLALFVALAFAGCGHSYGRVVVVALPNGDDVAWVVEDGGRIVRCINMPERPQCRRADVQ